MKYIKTFEIHVVDLDNPHLVKYNNNLPIDSKFKIGDYVRLKDDSEKNIYKIEYYHDIKKYHCYINKINFYSKSWIEEDKLEFVPDYEVSANKYNI